MRRLPESTYRLQFRSGFSFARARSVVPYLSSLGVGAVYCSPLLTARAGSTHGYDVIDPTTVDASLGGMDRFRAFASAVRDAGMGLVLDIVPNHMAASVENPWWADVLRRGRKSRYASWFDIDWSRGKLVLPVLGEPYASARLRLSGGSLRYGDLALPLSGPPGPVDEVVARQHYVPSYWRYGLEGLNYRRFFDVSDLVCIRQEEPGVFEATHALVLSLVLDGLVTGLRVDHVDGLADPGAYLRRLRDEIGDGYLVVEKILGRDEDLPREWPVDGTTGYEFANAVDETLVDPSAVEVDEDAELWAKRHVVEELFAPDVDRLVRRLQAAARAHPLGRDLSRSSLWYALTETTAALDVYRTYGPRDRRRVLRAIGVASSWLDDKAALRFLRSVLTSEGELTTAWRQLTGPVAAKGVEDTALYRGTRLVSLNEVGGSPGATPDPSRLHALNATRAARWRGAMNTGSTHDTKRSEDVRARIDALSEIGERWSRVTATWSRRFRALDVGPAMSELAFQTVAGAWPIDAGRLSAYLLKAAREAKWRTSWLRPDETYERTVEEFARALASDERVAREVRSLLRVVGPAGALNSLAALVLRMASPGVPDVYQGNEVPRYDLVDPDNRRPVDFAALAVALRQLPDDPASLVHTWQDGRLKLFVLSRLLHARRAHRDLFLRGDYTPLRTGSEHLIAFTRRWRRSWLVVVVPRLTVRLGRFPTGDAWGDAALELPPGRAQDALTRALVEGGAVAASHVLARLPVAVLVGGGSRKPTATEAARTVPYQR